MSYALDLSRGGVSALAVAMRHGISVSQVIADRKAIQNQREQQRRAERMAPVLRAQAEAAKAQIEAEMIAFTRALNGDAWREMFVTKPFASHNVAERPWNAGSAVRNDAAFRSRRAYAHTLGGVADYSSVPEAA